MGRIIKLLFVLLIIGVVSYVFYLNPTPAEVKFGPNSFWRMPMALILIVTFCVGALTTAVFAFFVGIKLRLRSWRENRQVEMVKNHVSLITMAREQLALGNLPAARTAFQKVIEKDPSDIPARVLLAKTYQREGKAKEALAVLENARIEQKSNIELLLAASDINSELGNETAAHDNAALVLKLAPKNRFALERLAKSAEKLSRFDEAISYQQQLIKASSSSEHAKREEDLAELKLQAAKAKHQEDHVQLQRTLEEIRHEHKHSPAVIDALAMNARALEDYDSASKLWLKLYQETTNVRCLAEIATTWLKAEEPGKAVAVVRNAISQKGAKTDAKLFFVSLLIQLTMLGEAKQVFDQIDPAELTNQELRDDYSLLKATLLRHDGQLDQAIAELTALIAPKQKGQDLGESGIDRLGPLNWPGLVRAKGTSEKAPQAPEPYLLTHWYDE